MMKKNYLYLTLILLIASLLRLWQLGSVPTGLFGDEIDVGYQAYSLLHTGRDYMGQFMPLYIHSLSEWRAPLFIYATVPTVWLFGLNEWGVRLSSAFFGILGVFLIYLLGKKIKSEKFGLISALVLAILPWHIHYSRAAFEVTLLLDLLLGATFLLLNFKTKWQIILAAVLFALTPYTYSTAALFTPLFIISILHHKRKEFKVSSLILFCITGLVVVMPFLYFTFMGPANSRFSLLSVFNDDHTIDQINIERSETFQPFEKVFHYKVIAWGEVIAGNYIRAFSPEFLFVNGDPNPRQNIPGTGELYWGFLVFLLLGVGSIFYKKSENKGLILLWLFLAPLPSAITTDGANHATRLFLMVTPIVFVAALGVEELWNKKNICSKLIFIISCLLILGNVSYYLHRYYVHYSYQNWKYWNVGYKQAMLDVVKNQDQYNRIFINNTYQPSLLEYLFWSKYDPKTFQSQFTGDVPKQNILPGFDGFRLGEKLYFGETKETGSLMQKGDLYLAAQEKEIPGDWDWSKTPPKDVKVFDVVHTPQNKPLFTIFTKQ